MVKTFWDAAPERVSHYTVGGSNYMNIEGSKDKDFEQKGTWKDENQEFRAENPCTK